MGTVDAVRCLLGEPALLDTYGEELPLIDHLLQTAELLWEDGGDAELAVAGLLHDVGLARRSSELHHARDGAQLALSLGFSTRVAELIALHVTAKRYLVRTDERYWGVLSRESRATLVEQGGPLPITEVEAFESSGHFDDAIRLRLADYMAKDPLRGARRVEHLYPIVDRALASSTARQDDQRR